MSSIIYLLLYPFVSTLNTAPSAATTYFRTGQHLQTEQNDWKPGNFDQHLPTKIYFVSFMQRVALLLWALQLLQVLQSLMNASME